MAQSAEAPNDPLEASFGPPLEGSETAVFKEVGGVQLRLHIFKPDGHRPEDSRAGVVFFFGGGWQGGNPGQFQEHSKHLASLGLVSICAEYRVKGKHGTTPFECVADGKSAVRWVRAHAAELGIDPERIVAGGGSAGGHVAACTGTLREFDENDEDLRVSSRPNALALLYWFSVNWTSGVPE